ncbi:MAG: TIGR00366 family protein [Marmoricola sp.]
MATTSATTHLQDRGLARFAQRIAGWTVDYRAIDAAAYMGLGAVWALGLSSSAAQLQATPESLPPDLLKISGVLDFGDTVLSWQSLTMAAVLIVLTVVISWFSAPQGKSVRTAEAMGVDLDDTVDPPRGVGGSRSRWPRCCSCWSRSP